METETQTRERSLAAKNEAYKQVKEQNIPEEEASLFIATVYSKLMNESKNLVQNTPNQTEKKKNSIASVVPKTVSIECSEQPKPKRVRRKKKPVVETQLKKEKPVVEKKLKKEKPIVEKNKYKHRVGTSAAGIDAALEFGITGHKNIVQWVQEGFGILTTPGRVSSHIVHMKKKHSLEPIILEQLNLL